MTFTDWPWRHWRQVRSQAPALRLNDEVLSWRALCERIDVLAGGFAAQGVRESDGVLLRAWNHPHTLLAWLALMQCGARVLPVNPQLPQSLLEALVPDFTLRFALTLEGENAFSGLTALQMRKSTEAYARGLATAASGFHDADIGFHRIAKSRHTHIPGTSRQRARSAFANAVWPPG
ncbi:O-succinylbenzoic acid-CoA ligase [Salmonella enterica subsp. arizonae]|uniref:O-succinylbenzoic acid-CoA ligase n=1 Tax=Salmonella enterica subsp. arizonae TaxID=59203 RepID=A0A379SVS1_SALER|nr:O-succinylbenzoic acid-CoA ligase [Salmonella enterica subsp. arizonae]